MASLNTIHAVHTDSSLAIVLTTLFEHSPILISRLEPELATTFRNGLKISSYSELVELALAHIEAWDVESQTLFISGHPRIGESDKLSSLSAKEQGAQSPNPTSPEVLGRLAHLNLCYETMYPGLRYITFVNGRSRAEILEEMENAMGLEHSLSLALPALGDLIAVDVTSEAWRSELTRAIHDVGRIAQSRLKALGV
jgi:2-oxo-4-hydroxy-4-carboxy--5-ureidoimidazoline (OHCU) decarboxylase